MTIVVTGAAGFLGRHVVARLLGAGDDVVGIDRRPWIPMAGEEVLRADLAAPDRRIDDALASARGVIHLAARPGVRDHTPDVERLRHRDNVLAGARVLDATPVGVPMVVTSSSSVYGGAGSPSAPRPCPEHAPLRPRGGYARSKLVLEQHCRARAQRGGRVHVARPFTVAGEGQRPDMALAHWIAALRAGEPATILGDVARRRDVTDARDVAEGLVRLLDVPGSEIVNLGTGVTHRLDELVTTVAAALGVAPRLRVVPVGHQEPPATCADTRRCHSLLGLRPHTDLPELVARQLHASTAPSAVAELATDTPVPVASA